MDMDWTEAACRLHDPELFFPVGTEGPAAKQITAAKQICGTCPIRSACLRWALETGTVDGIWGGASEDERRDMLLRRPALRSLSLAGAPRP